MRSRYVAQLCRTTLSRLPPPSSEAARFGVRRRRDRVVCLRKGKKERKGIPNRGKWAALIYLFFQGPLFLSVCPGWLAGCSVPHLPACPGKLLQRHAHEHSVAVTQQFLLRGRNGGCNVCPDVLGGALFSLKGLQRVQPTRPVRFSMI